MADQQDIHAAADAVHDAYRAAAASTIAHTREIADARRTLAATLRDDEPQPLPVPPALTAADIAEIHAAETDLGIDQRTHPSPEQTVALLRRLPDTLAAVLVAHWLDRMGTGRLCIELGHEGQLELTRSQLYEATTAHRCWDHTHERIDLGG